MRCTLEIDTPLAMAMLRELQWVAPGGRLSKVRTITASIRASSNGARRPAAGLDAQALQPMLGEAPAPLAYGLDCPSEVARQQSCLAADRL